MRHRRKPWDRWQVLSWMASLYAVTGERRSAEAYLVDLFVLVSFSKDEPRVASDS